ncbi:MAG: hypothetical protein IT384_09965 [Deltaproteobacteria bacterium]|nr:hypothetical protein [Deltaproteobacteria bacterium]
MLWTNFASAAGSTTRRNHVDNEWRFHDVDLSAEVQDHGVSVSFDLTTNRRRRLGGWTLDDVCIVGVPAQCGNGRVEEGETCDDANGTAGDGCERDCTATPAAPVCGNGRVEAGEACDDGVLDGTACAAGCTLPAMRPSDLPETLKDEGCGCRTTGARTGGSAGLIGLVLLGAIVLRRRRG